MCDPQKLLTIKDAADLLSVNQEVLRRWLRQGQMTGVKIGSDWRLRMSDLERYLAPEVDDKAPGTQQGPKMCLKLPKWIEFSGLPAKLNGEHGPETWPVFKKLVELDYEKEEREDRRVFWLESLLPERVGYAEAFVRTVLTKLEKTGLIKQGHDRQKGDFIRIITPIRTPRMILDIPFAQGGIRGAPEQACENRCLRRYLEPES